VTPTPLVWVIVLNWQRTAETLHCLESLDRLTYGNRHVIVVDNGSSDGSERAVRAARPDVPVLQTGANLGYAGGNNTGIRAAIAAGAEFVWILNNDTEVEPDALDELVRIAEADPQVGALATRLVELDSGRTAEDAFSLTGDRMVALSCDGCARRDAHPADVLGGPSLLLRTRALDEVGLFDVDYFHYYEEADLMERLRRSGWRLGLACRAAIHHARGGSLSYASPQSQYYLLRNCLLYRRKLHHEHPLRFVAREPQMVRYALGLRRAVVTRDFRPTRAALKALFDALRNRTGRRDLGADYQRALPGLVAYSPVEATLRTSSPLASRPARGR
jgi:GT2 family glycosyltransferase